MGKDYFFYHLLILRIIFFSRTVHSLVKLLALFPGIRLVYVCPESLRMPEEIIDEVNSISMKHFGTPIEQV